MASTLQQIEQRERELGEVEAQAKQVLKKDIPQRRFGRGITRKEQQQAIEKRREAKEVLSKVETQKRELKSIKQRAGTTLGGKSQERKDYETAYKFAVEGRNPVGLENKRQRRLYAEIREGVIQREQYLSKLKKLEQAGIKPIFDAKGNLIGVEDYVRGESFEISKVPGFSEADIKRYEGAGFKFEKKDGQAKLTAKEKFFERTFPPGEREQTLTFQDVFGEERYSRLATGTKKTALQELQSGVEPIARSLTAGGIALGRQQSPGQELFLTKETEAKKEFEERASYVGTPQDALAGVIGGTALATPLPVTTKVAIVLNTPKLSSLLSPVETKAEREQQKATLKELGTEFVISAGVGGAISGGVSALGVGGKVLTSKIPSPTVKNVLSVTGLGVQKGASTVYQAYVIGESLTVTDLLKKGQTEQAKLKTASVTGTIVGFEGVRMGAGAIARKVILKQELKSLTATLPKKQAEKFLAEIETAKVLRGVQPQAKELSFVGMSRIPVKAREPILKFIQQKKLSLVVGGSVAQRTQLAIKERQAPSDIDIYVRGAFQELKARKYAKSLAGILKGAGVRASISPRDPSKVTIAGAKAVEFLPASAYIKPNLEQILPYYRTYRAGVTKTPSGIRVMTLSTQLQRKLIASYVDPKRIETGKAREVDYPTAQLIFRSLEVTRLKQAKEVKYPIFLSAGITTIDLKTPKGIKFSLASARRGGGRVEVAYPSYKPFKFQSLYTPYKAKRFKTPSIPYAPFRDSPYRPIKPPGRRPPFIPPTKRKKEIPYVTYTPFKPPRTPPYTPRTPILPRVPGITPGKTPKKGKSPFLLLDKKDYKAEEGKLSPGFFTFVFRGGKKVYLPGVRTKGRALRFGATRTKKTLRATFGVEPAGLKLRKKDITFTPSQRIFRSYRVKEGRKVPLRDTFIQRTTPERGVKGGRLAFKSEVKALQTARMKL